MEQNVNTYTVKFGDNYYTYENSFLDGIRQENGPACPAPKVLTYTVKVGDKYEHWFLNDTIHREDGPAVIDSEGTKQWYRNGLRHREDGPAIEYTDGSNRWYLNGIWLLESEFNARMNPVKELTVAEIEKLLGYSVKIVK